MDQSEPHDALNPPVPSPRPRATIRDYRDLRVWKKSVRLAEECEALAATFPPHAPTLADRIRTLARTVSARIAEGQSSGRLRAYLERLGEAVRNLSGLEEALIAAYSAGWVRAEAGDRLLMKLADLRRMLRNLVRSLEACRTKREVRR